MMVLLLLLLLSLLLLCRNFPKLAGMTGTAATEVREGRAREGRGG